MRRRCSPPFNMPQTGARFAPRVLRTALTDALERDPEHVDSAAVAPRLLAEIRAGAGHESLPFTGQSVELVHDVVPAAALVARLWRECEQALEAAGTRMPPTSRTPGGR
jgi:enoyl-[acyl-carrier protein] reductase II